jgi:hypothetical protein
MEAAHMRSIVTFLAGLLIAGAAMAGDVYVTKDAKGVPVYTDRPDTLPADRVGIKSASTDDAEVEARYQEQMSRYAADDADATDAAAKAADAAKAKAETAEDKAKRCADARQRYEAYMNAIRLYEQPATGGERRYLTNEELDKARANAKQTMDEFCAGQ